MLRGSMLRDGDDELFPAAWRRYCILHQPAANVVAFATRMRDSRPAQHWPGRSVPVGTPLGGYTARCECIGGFVRADYRDSAYSTSFVESTGLQTQPMVKTLWLENGDDELVMVKVDLIYSFDGLVTEVTKRLQELLKADPEKDPPLEHPLHAWISIVREHRAGVPVADVWNMLAARYRLEQQKRRKLNK